jgi:hypothetical protein
MRALKNNHKCYHLIISMLLSLNFINFSFAGPTEIQLTVWVSEAVISTYTFDHKNFLKQQKAIAKYYTSDGWINYTKAFEASKLPETVKKHSYTVTSVPLFPPVIKNISMNQWQATIPILVVYQNPGYKQKQTLKVVVDFVKTDNGGVNGFAITNLISTVTEEPCQCAALKIKAVAAIV